MDDEVFRGRTDPDGPGPHRIGQGLDDLSIDDLDARLALLRREIERIEAVREAKQMALTAAGSIFKL